MSPLVSVLTPSWNRASYLYDLWKGLSGQSYKNIEWVVGDDGSTDSTADVINELAKKSNIPIYFISYDRRVGKSRIDNELVKMSNGDLIIWCDSDDILKLGAIEMLVNVWNSIPENEKGMYLGITALCECEGAEYHDNNGTKLSISDINFNRLAYNLRADLVILARADLLKQNPFVEVDYLIPENSVWSKLGVLKTRFIPIPLKTVRYNQSYGISFNGLMEYNRGRAYSLAITQKYLSPLMSTREKIKSVINFIRYSIHGDLPFIKQCAIWIGGGGGVFLIFIFAPVALIYAVRDNLRGNVRKTHIEFSKSIKSANYSYFKYNTL